MTTVPSNLIPTRITQLPEYQGVSTAGYLPYVIDGVTYKVQFSNIAAVGAVPSSRTITGGSGLTGGGDLSADRVISIATGGVGFSQLADSGVVAGTYGDASNIPVLAVDAKGRVTTASTTPISLTGYVPTSRSILAGAGLTGGGTLAADRTISLDLSTASPQPGGVPAAGTGTVAAREDHVHPAVDLSDTTETSGVLPMSRGGTGNSLSPVAGAIVYSDGGDLNLSNPGSANQLFFSEGGSAPVWRSLTGGSTGLTFGLSGGDYALSGTLAVANGGTGAVTAAAARSNLGAVGAGLITSSGLTMATARILGRTTAATGAIEEITIGSGLTLSGGVLSTAGGGTGTVTSVDVSGGTTGLTFSGGPVTTSGTITMAGTLAVANGGTGQTSYTNGQLLIGNSTGNTLTKATLTAGTAIGISNGAGSITITNSAPDQTVVLTGAGTTSITGTYPNFTITSNDQFSGTVTTVSVVSTNGFAGTVANATTTPAITLTTSVTGIVKGNGTALSAASAGTDYVAPGAYITSGLTMATSRLLGRTTAGTGAAEEITVGSGLSLTGGTLTATGGGGMVYPGAGIAVSTGSAWGTSLTAPSGAIVGTTDTQTLTNKRYTPRVSSTASISSPLAWNSDNFDQYAATAQSAALTINADAGTPTDGQRILFRFKDNGTARSLTWTTGSSKSFRAVGVTLPTTTVINKVLYVGCIYNAAEDRWDALAVGQEA